MLRQIINDDDVYRIREPADRQTDGQTDGRPVHASSFLLSFLRFFTVLFEELLIKKHSAYQCELPMAVTAV